MNLDQIISFTRRAERRAQRVAFVGGLMMLLTATAIGFATAAVYLALAPHLGAVNACLLIAMANLLIALVIFLMVRGAGETERERESPPERPELEPDAISHLIATFLAGVRAGRQGFAPKRD